MTQPPASELPTVDNGKYTSEEIQVLEGLEAIRKRPGMYVGGTGLNAVHQLVYECVDNSIDEAMAGFATQVEVRIGVDGSCTVQDDGRGMPVDPMRHDNPAIDGRSAVEVILTEVHAGGKFDNNAYKVSGGLHGVGVKCVNALSEWTEVEVHKDGKAHRIAFSRGAVTEPLHVVREGLGARDRGTRISFLPDAEVFPDIEFRYDTLEFRLRELAYLNPGVKIRFVDERVDDSGQIRTQTFCDNDGIRAYVTYLNEAKSIQSSCIGIVREDEARGFCADIAFQWTDATSENILAFGNNIRNPDGGTHLSGFKTALTRVVNGYARQNGLVKDLVPSGEDLREGLTAVVSVKLPNPQFNNQTKEKLLNEEIEGFISQALGEEFTAWLDKNPAEAKKICQRAVLAAEAREAARKARDLVKRKGALGDSALPQKLADCSSSDVEKTEIFIVEGDSAGGSAKGGRDHVHQAILPLRGKLLNVEKCRLDKVLAFEEIQTLVQALQCGIGADMDIAKLRYGRIIIMTDADVDGSHIRTLLLTLFFRQMTELVRTGRIYIAQAPLYQIARGKQVQYVLSDRQMGATLGALALKHSVLVVRGDDGRVSRRVEGTELQQLLRKIERLEELATISRRRGILFTRLIESRDQRGGLPRWHLAWGAGDALCRTEEEAREMASEKKLTIVGMNEGEDSGTGNGNGSGNGSASSHSNGAVSGSATAAAAHAARAATLRELHENAELERIFAALEQSGLSLSNYATVQQEGVTGEKLPTRFGWLVASDKDGQEPEMVEAANIPAILGTLHDVGRRGIEIKRFKGLGEMEAEQLWETTMDPARRTLLRVSMEAAAEAEKLFTVLMGEDVERRRAYIEKHALEVKNIDV
ncbi:MAG: DNA gyrase subunit B [Planctomycetota bacterium]|nr:DNA gyrase subunit B [Planctomycetota bacterium]MDA1106605.1 DNA gyrase subunit B [Planctomycetota bacterium]